MNVDGSIVVARPAVAKELVLLLHGVGASARDLVPLARLVAERQTHAMVVSVDAPAASDFGSGRQWFSVQGISEASRPGRIAKAMPQFQKTVEGWQSEAGVAARGTTLIGFSQGAIMALESTQVDPALASRIVSLSGRFATAVRRVPGGVAIHLIHGGQDGVVGTEYSVQAASQLRQLGAQVTLDVVPGLGHGIDKRVTALVQDYVAGRDHRDAS
jgi:phospholipase/carboxylesterase